MNLQMVRGNGQRVDEPVLAATDVTKAFGHVKALRGASLEVWAGEVVALFGDNGAGKSTLMKVLCGIYQPDDGALKIAGREVMLASIRDAHALGVQAVHQDLALAPDISVLESMFLGHELLRSGWRHYLRVLDRRTMARAAHDALRRLSIDLPSVSVPVRDLSGGQRQAVAVARAVMWSGAAVLMDEPTAALGPRQSDIVCKTIRATADRGLAVLVVSHDIPRLLGVADRIAVLRQGRVVHTAPSRGVALGDIVGAMVGQEIGSEG
jgi:simple sugar transport system ATP-binding protein